jgi:hypothetical protein
VVRLPNLPYPAAWSLQILFPSCFKLCLSNPSVSNELLFFVPADPSRAPNILLSRENTQLPPSDPLRPIAHIGIRERTTRRGTDFANYLHLVVNLLPEKSRARPDSAASILPPSQASPTPIFFPPSCAPVFGGEPATSRKESFFFFCCAFLFRTGAASSSSNGCRGLNANFRCDCATQWDQNRVGTSDWKYRHG